MLQHFRCNVSLTYTWANTQHLMIDVPDGLPLSGSERCYDIQKFQFQSFGRMDNRYVPLSMPDLKANLSEENLLALASSSGNSSDDLSLNRDDDASKLSDFSAALKKSKLTKRLMTTVTNRSRSPIGRIVHVGVGGGVERGIL